MNQILMTNSSIYNNLNNKKRNKFFFKIQFIFSIILTIICISSYIFFLYNLNKKEQLSTNISNNFKIARLYSNNSDYILQHFSSNNNSNGNLLKVIGLIEIDKIQISYPFFDEINDELLKIAPCKFYGPKPNETGNLCIAGHNYESYKFFSNLKDLQAGDEIKIYDLSGKTVKYIIYEKLQVDPTNMSITNQKTDGLKEITLVTCNNFGTKRTVIKAREI